MGLLAFLFRAIMVLFVFRLAGVVLRAFMGGFRMGARPDAPSGSTQRGRPQEPGRIEDLVRDPVCGVHTARSAAIPGRFEGRDAYFCSEECAAKARG